MEGPKEDPQQEVQRMSAQSAQLQAQREDQQEQCEQQEENLLPETMGKTEIEEPETEEREAEDAAQVVADASSQQEGALKKVSLLAFASNQQLLVSLAAWSVDCC
ncbi:unnamed protein product [Polarella glacialis]|uniref:Uncharacterized protein n=1 Tax=Polarella glacialis TaxID=89957 RepID=A0A813K0P2_POLGL|nr:unnamed protein product [Polarella glacialis]